MPFLNFTGRADFLSYIKNLIIKPGYPEDFYRKLNVFEDENAFFHQSVQDYDFQQLNQWRKDLPRGTRLLNQLIIQKTHPNMLRKQLLARLEQVDKTISSPIYYHLYLQKLENKLADKTPWQYGYVLQEARARLREKIKADPDRAVTYLHNDLSYQLARLSGGQIPLKLLKQTLAYYKRLVPEDYYSAMKQILDTFVVRYETNQVTEKTYGEFQTEFNELVQSYFEPCEETDLALSTFSWSNIMKGFVDLACHPQWMLLAMGMLVDQGILLARSNQSNSSGALGLQGTLHNISPLVLGGVMHHWYKGHNQPVSSLHNMFPLAMNMLPLLQFAKADTMKTFLTTFGWNNGDTEILYNIAPTNDSGSILIGSTREAYNMFLLKFDAEGKISWDKIVESEFFVRGFVEQLPNGNYITAISVSDSAKESKDILLIAWDPKGNIVWGQKIIGPFDDEVFSAIPTKDNAIVATGYIQDLEGENTFLGKWSANHGQQIWFKSFDSGTSRGIFVVQKTDGNYLVIGYGVADGGFGGQDILLSEWDANGDVLWVKALGTPEDDYGRFILQDKTIDSGFVVSGFMGDKDTPTELDSLLIKLDQNYNITWSNRLSAPNNFVNVQQTPSGNYFTPGTFFDISSEYYKPLLAQWLPNGTLISSQALNWSPQNHSAYIFSQLADDGSLFVLGNSNVTGVKNSVLVKFDSNGTLDDCTQSQQVMLSNITNIALQLAELNINFLAPNVTLSSWLASSLDTDTIYSLECPTSNNNAKPWFKLEYVIPAAFALFITTVVVGAFYKKRKQIMQGYQTFQQDIDIETPSDISPNSHANSEKRVTIPHIPREELTIGPRLGEGMCQVYQGLVPSYGRVAIKDLTSGLSRYKRKTYKSHIEREVNLLASVRHENIIQLYGVCIGRDQEYYMIMQLMDKGSLATYLYDKEYRKRIMTEDKREKIALGIVHGLFYLHTRKGENEQIQPIIHADLKPANILLDNSYNPKLCDFGFSRIYAYNQKSRDRRSLRKAIGSEDYRDPALSEKNSQCTTETDMYSCAFILNELAWVAEIGEKEDLHAKAVKAKEIPRKCPLTKAQLIRRCWAERSQRPTAGEIYRKLLDLRPHTVNPNIQAPVHVDILIKPEIKGLVYESVSGKGNCLLKSVSVSLGRDEAQLRQEAINCLHSNNEQLDEALLNTEAITKYASNLLDSEKSSKPVLLPTDLKQAAEEYIQSTYQGSGGALANTAMNLYTQSLLNYFDLPSNFELDLLMLTLQKPIIVIESIGSAGLFMNPEDVPKYEGDPIFICHAGSRESSHYDAYLLEQGANAREVLETLHVSSIRDYADYLGRNNINNNNNMSK